MTIKAVGQQAGKGFVQRIAGVVKAWFPKELDEPDIALLKVTATKAEYWDAPASWVAKTVGFIKAATTGEQENMTENAKIDLS